MTKLKINYPKLDEVIAEANRKKLSVYRIFKLTGQSSETVYKYFNGEPVSRRTEERIVDVINEYPEPPKEDEEDEQKK